MNTLGWWLMVVGVVCWSMTLASMVILTKMTHRHHDEIEQRLKDIRPHSASPDRYVHRKLSQFDLLDHWLERSSLAKTLDHWLVVAGFRLSLDAFAGLILASLFILNALLVFAHGTATWHIVISIAVVLTPYLYVRHAIKRRSALFEQQLPDVLDFISRAMQAGHSFGVAMQIAASEAPEPIKTEFSRTQSELNVGVPAQQALSDLASRIDSTDLRFFAIAVTINREIGGDLAGLLNNLSAIIRSRIEMRATLRALTAEGRLSAIILSILPFLIGFVLYLIQPQTVSVLWTSEVGLDLLSIGLMLMGLGVLWMRRIIRIRV